MFTANWLNLVEVVWLALLLYCLLLGLQRNQNALEVYIDESCSSLSLKQIVLMALASVMGVAVVFSLLVCVCRRWRRRRQARLFAYVVMEETGEPVLCGGVVASVPDSVVALQGCGSVNFAPCSAFHVCSWFGGGQRTAFDAPCHHVWVIEQSRTVRSKLNGILVF
jgi:hypothetical protein